MKRLLIEIAIAIAIASCGKDELNIRPGGVHTLTFDLGVPSLSSKVPTCKTGTPDRIVYNVTNERNEEFTYYGDIIFVDGRYQNMNEIELPTGNYLINSIELIQGNEPLYAVPDNTDGSILHYANLILPMEITLIEDTIISGTAFCYDQVTPDFDALLDGTYDTLELESLFFQVLDRGCTAMVTVTIDGYRVPEVVIFESGVYEIAVPKEYNTMILYSYDAEGIELLNKHYFTSDDPYNSDTLLIFNNSCD